MDIGVITAIVIIAIVVVIMLLGRRGHLKGLMQLSHLRCKKCGSEFDYAYIPGASFASIRIGNSRYIKCPVCYRRSFFNIWDTRVDPKTHHCDKRVGPN